jgi:hypothetical protein
LGTVMPLAAVVSNPPAIYGIDFETGIQYHTRNAVNGETRGR